MALTKDDNRLAAERLHRAEKTRRQIRQLSLDHPDITIRPIEIRKGDTIQADYGPYAKVSCYFA